MAIVLFQNSRSCFIFKSHFPDVKYQHRWWILCHALYSKTARRFLSLSNVRTDIDFNKYLMTSGGYSIKGLRCTGFLGGNSHYEYLSTAVEKVCTNIKIIAASFVFNVQYTQEICTRFLLCCALLWLYIDWFSHIHQAYFTGTVAI